MRGAAKNRMHSNTGKGRGSRRGGQSIRVCGPRGHRMDRWHFLKNTYRNSIMMRNKIWVKGHFFSKNPYQENKWEESVFHKNQGSEMGFTTWRWLVSRTPADLFLTSNQVLGSKGEPCCARKSEKSERVAGHEFGVRVLPQEYGSCTKSLLPPWHHLMFCTLRHSQHKDVSFVLI